MADNGNNEKEKLIFPDLPTTIKGDGRYLISVLRKYLKSVNHQVNLANGFTADGEGGDGDGDYIMPKNFTLTFDRLGGVLSWDRVADDKLAYYETRTDTNVGFMGGLLDRTTETTSLVLPTNFVATIYLYAVSSEGKISNPATLTYNKRRPDAPTDISLNKNNEGTLITFLEIPTDCLGANLYIDGVKYSTIDNIYLYEGADIKVLEICYYDQFGEGERAYIYCDIPNVTGFWVEKNGANLDFYWDAIAIYNVKYIVKVGQTHDWNQGLELFTTRLNKHRYVRPNEGEFYFMIKAADDHNNFSPEATWYHLVTIEEINKNIILNFDQEELGYSGNKINMYLDSSMGGLRLEQTAFNGEYIMQINLPQKIRARNWIDLKLNAVTSGSIRVCDANFPVNSYEAEHLLVVGIIGDLDGVELRKQIARKIDEEDILFSAITDGTTSAAGGTIDENHNVTMQGGRWHDGALITDVTHLSYEVAIPETFSIGFWIKKTTDMTDCIIAELVGTAAILTIGYDAVRNVFYARDTVHAEELSAAVEVMERDWIYIGISQSSSERLLFLYALSYNSTASSKDGIPPCGAFSLFSCQPHTVS